MANINIGVTGNSVSAFLQDAQRRAQELANAMIASARDQSLSAKETLKNFEDQIRAIERKLALQKQAALLDARNTRDSAINSGLEDVAQRQREWNRNRGSISKEEMRRKTAEFAAEREDVRNNAEQAYRDRVNGVNEEYEEERLQTRLLRDTVDAIRQSSREMLAQMRRGDDSIVNAIEDTDDNQDNSLAGRLAREQRNRENKGDEDGDDAKKEGILSSLIRFGILKNALQSLRTLGQTQNGYDSVGAAGGMIGGALGSIVSMIATPAIGAVVDTGVQLIADTLGKTGMNRQMLFAANNRVQALSGRSDNAVFDAQSYGFSYTEVGTAQREVLNASKTSRNLNDQTQDYLTYQKGYGVDSGVLLQMLEVQRSSESTNGDLNRTIQGVLQLGSGSVFKDDRALLPTFLTNMTALQKEMLRGSEEVKDSTAAGIMMMFNSMGGQFGVMDPRSSANISAIQSGLTNPASDNIQALSFVALQRLHPGMSLADMMVEREGGMNSPGYLKSMIDLVEQMGGDESTKRLNLGGLFPGLSAAAVKRLYNNRASISNGTFNDFANVTRDAALGEAERGTTDLEKNQAEITNAYIRGGTEGIKAATEAVASALLQSLSNIDMNVTIIQDPNGGRPRTQINVNSVQSNVRKGGANLGAKVASVATSVATSVALPGGIGNLGF